MRLVWDLDGVMRNLMWYLTRKYSFSFPIEWDWNVDGKDIYDLVKDDGYKCLRVSPITQFGLYANISGNVEIWSHQPDDWKEHTKHWLDRNFSNYSIKYMLPEEKVEVLRSEPDTLLVEDHPGLSDYSQIVLVSMPYNREVPCKRRVYNVKDLMKIEGLSTIRIS